MATAIITALGLLLGLVPPAAAEQQRPGPPTVAADVVAALGQRDRFRRFVQALEVAGLAEALRGAGPFTVFAPTDEAFARLPPGTVRRLLERQNRARLGALVRHHIVAGAALPSAALPERLEPMAGGPIAVSLVGGRVVLRPAEGRQGAGQAPEDGRARVVAGDIAAGNGVIHAVDAVLVPQAVQPVLQPGRR